MTVEVFWDRVDRLAGRDAHFAPEEEQVLVCGHCQVMAAVLAAMLAAFDMGVQAAGARFQVSRPTIQHFQIADWIDKERARLAALMSPAEGEKE
jgi:hypothetical protein